MTLASDGGFLVLSIPMYAFLIPLSSHPLPRLVTGHDEYVALFYFMYTAHKAVSLLYVSINTNLPLAWDFYSRTYACTLYEPALFEIFLKKITGRIPFVSY